MAAVYALRAEQAGRGRQKTFNVILSPSHVANKWAREISETLPDTAGVVVCSNTELDRLYDLYEKGDKSIYAIITKEKARDGFMKRPAVIWNRRQGAYLCPDCWSLLRRPSRRTESGTRARSTSFSSARRTAKTTSAATAAVPSGRRLTPAMSASG